MSDLLECYKRTVWMLNASIHSEERYVGCTTTVCTCLWQTCDHRHDPWRYYALAYELCAVAESLELYKECEIADCYTPELLPVEPVQAKTFSVPRQKLPYNVRIDGRRYSGVVDLHSTICAAVRDDILPMFVVEYELIIPRLLRRHEISANSFLDYMDRFYCDNYAYLMRSAYIANFSRVYGRAIAALAMENGGPV